MRIPEFLGSGAFTVGLEASPEGLLRGVRLPPTPPKRALPGDLERLLQELESLPLHPARDAHEAAFRSALRDIPAGETRAYGALAQTLHSSPRAIASRCAGNRLLLVVPCHRVVGKHSVGGYQLGLEWKTLLLELEDAISVRKLNQTNSPA